MKKAALPATHASPASSPRGRAPRAPDRFDVLGQRAPRNAHTIDASSQRRPDANGQWVGQHLEAEDAAAQAVRNRRSFGLGSSASSNNATPTNDRRGVPQFSRDPPDSLRPKIAPAAMVTSIRAEGRGQKQSSVQSRQSALPKLARTPPSHQQEKQ